MKNIKYFLNTAGVVFTLASLLHLVRAVNGWDLVLGPYLLPVWVSWVVFIIAGDLAWNSFRFARKK